MRTLLFCLCLPACALGALVLPDGGSSGTQTVSAVQQAVLDEIDGYRQRTWRWQRLMGQPRTPFSNSARHSDKPEYHRWVRDLWKRRLARARRQAAHPPHLGAWRCIQRYEAPWYDPSPPYYGGLQMDLHFQRTYGGWLLHAKGTADRWTPIEQMWVAERAHRSGRGFTPWPNTARLCGVL
jgi:hypothetical protein